MKKIKKNIDSFVISDTVLVNEHEGRSRYLSKLVHILKLNNLKYICAPCSSLDSGLSATGLYINYLHVGNAMFVPVFDLEQNEAVVLFFEDVFYDCKIIPVK